MFLRGYLHYEIYNKKSISHQTSEPDPAPTKVRAKTSTDFSGSWIRPTTLLSKLYILCQTLIVEQSFWQQKPLSETWPATLPTPLGKHLGRAVSCAGLEKKGCSQNKGHLHQTKGRSQMRQRGGRGAKGEWLLRKTLVWLVNQKWGSWDRLWGKLGRSFWQAVLQGQREVSMGKSGMVEKGRQQATETGIKRNNKEKAQQETSAAVATIISKTQKGVCLVKAKFSTAQWALQTAMGTRFNVRGGC